MVAFPAAVCYTMMDVFSPSRGAGLREHSWSLSMENMDNISAVPTALQRLEALERDNEALRAANEDLEG